MGCKRARENGGSATPVMCPILSEGPAEGLPQRLPCSCTGSWGWEARQCGEAGPAGRGPRERTAVEGLCPHSLRGAKGFRVSHLGAGPAPFPTVIWASGFGSEPRAPHLSNGVCTGTWQCAGQLTTQGWIV